MSIPAYNAEQRDAFQEILNCATIQASDNLATVLKHSVKLSFPRFKLVTVENLVNMVNGILYISSDIAAVRQAFYNGLRGEAIVIYPQLGVGEIQDLMGYEITTVDSNAEQEILLDFSNLLVGALLSNVSDTLSINLGYSAPSMITLHQPVNKELLQKDRTWSHALLLDINFTLEPRNFKSHMFIFMTDDTISLLNQLLDVFLKKV